jgi:uncharacterized protein YjbI with pentapeptide repeats
MVRELLARPSPQCVRILGPAGSGKTTALQHLAAVLPVDNRVLFLDEPGTDTVKHHLRRHHPVICTGHKPRDVDTARFRLAPWDNDDLIEYLLSAHRPRCASVMSRIKPADRVLLGGLPELWRVVLDELAADNSLPDGRAALRQHLSSLLGNTEQAERVGAACLQALAEPPAPGAVHALVGLPAGLVRLLRLETVRTWLAAERVAAGLGGEAVCRFLALRLSRDVLRLAASAVRDSARAVQRLRELVRVTGPGRSQAMAASLLRLLDPAWVVDVAVHVAPADLGGAYLDRAPWPGARLEGAILVAADLSFADLTGALLAGAKADGTNFQGACLRQADLTNLSALGADLREADLREALGSNLLLTGADLEGADLTEAALPLASLASANLTGAALAGADLSGVVLTGAKVEDTDFTGADMERASLDGLPLRSCRLAGARLAGARMLRCDLEGLDLADADFSGALLQGALLTGTSSRGASFQGADLREAGLAEIDWEGADLRGADLRGSSFHLGSTRCGLVGSTIPCEGSRTGFYTDDSEEQHFKAPEEVRKANLCGADLRGAIIENVDFYLVDLRGARYDPQQEEHLRRCRAILEARL